MINVNLIYDVRDIGWLRRGLLSGAEVRDALERKRRKVKRLGLAVVGLWLTALVLAFLPSLPQVFYWLSPSTTAAMAEQLSTTGDIEKSEFGEIVYEAPSFVPELDESLPRENRLVIPEIGFDSQIGEAPINDVESVLKNGPWRVPELGTPELTHAPLVIAAHRFGYIHWTNQFRRENSFYNLPKLESGDQIEVIWNQRKYVYEVFEGYTDTKIRGFDADLILYTCEMLNSPRRVVRLARLVNPDAEPQVSTGFGKLLGQI